MLGRPAIALLISLIHLLVAAIPCAATPMAEMESAEYPGAGVHAEHHEHPAPQAQQTATRDAGDASHEGGAMTSLSQPCPCGCGGDGGDKGTAGSRLSSGLLAANWQPYPARPLPELPRAIRGEVPIAFSSIDPVPI